MDIDIESILISYRDSTLIVYYSKILSLNILSILEHYFLVSKPEVVLIFAELKAVKVLCPSSNGS